MYGFIILYTVAKRAIKKKNRFFFSKIRSSVREKNTLKLVVAKNTVLIAYCWNSYKRSYAPAETS